MSSKYDVDAIVALSSVEAVRARPNLYLGSLEDGETMACYVVQALCLSVDACLAGKATRVDVRMNGDEIEVSDDGPGVALAEEVQSTRLLDRLFTHLLACRLERKHPDVGEGLCSNGICVTNALSRYLEVDTTHNGQRYEARFEKGRLVRDLTITEAPGESGWRVAFAPDLTIFTQPLSLEQVRARVESVAADFPVANVRFATC